MLTARSTEILLQSRNHTVLTAADYGALENSSKDQKAREIRLQQYGAALPARLSEARCNGWSATLERESLYRLG